MSISYPKSKNHAGPRWPWFAGLLFAFLSSTPPSALQAADASSHAERKGSLSALAMSDYYYVVSDHRSELRGANGFRLRRIYLTYDRQLPTTLSARVRLELKSAGDFETQERIEPVLKDAFVKYAFADANALILGLSGTPTWAVVEEHWGYRSLEKTPLDLQKLGSSRDFGIALRGRLGKGKKFGYHVMIGNGEGNKSETNKGKKAHGSVSVRPTGGLIVQTLGDYETSGEGARAYTLQGFAGYESTWGRTGLLYAHRKSRSSTEPDPIQLDLASIYLVGHFSESLSGCIRMDRMFEPNPAGEDIEYIPFASTARSTFLLTGIDYHPIEGFFFMPNIEVILYDGPTNDAPLPDPDVIARVTVFYTF